MRDKENSCDGAMSSPHGENLRNRIRSDLERLGMDAQFSEDGGPAAGVDGRAICRRTSTESC